jgi:hypothetical protein
MQFVTKQEPIHLPWYPEWTRDAACAKHPLDVIDDLFFDYGRNKRKIQEAKAICGTCPVIRKCFQQNREVPIGIFYGMTAIERWRERGLTGYPNTSDAYSYFARFFSRSPNGIGPRVPKNKS